MRTRGVKEVLVLGGFGEPDATDRRANGKAGQNFASFLKKRHQNFQDIDNMRLRPSNSGPISLLTPRPFYIPKGRPFLTAFNSDPISISIQRNMP